MTVRWRGAFASKLGMVLPISWLGIVAWRSLVLFHNAMPSLSLPGWFSKLAAGPWWLLVGMMGWQVGLIVVRLWRPQHFPVAVVIWLGLPCGILLVTSRQVAAGLAILWLGTWSWLIGLTILDRLRINLEPIACLALSLVLGGGSLAILVLFLGLVGLLHYSWIMTVSVLMASGLCVFSSRAIKAWMRDLVREWRSVRGVSWFALFCFLLVAPFVIVNWIGALAPEIMFDALKSHLALARIYASNHYVAGVPYSMGSYWPLGGELLITLGYVLAGEPGAKLLHFGAGLLTAGAVYAIGKRMASRLMGLVATVIFYTTPIVAWESTTANIDLFWTMYVGGALVLLYVWLDTCRSTLLATGIGLLLGFALGVKPSAAYVALGVGLVMLGCAWKRRHDGWREAFRSLLVVSLVTTLVGGIWYLRTFLLTGNPVFPFLNGIFRSSLWYLRNEEFNFSSFGFGTRLPALLSLPWRLTFDTSHFCETLDGAMGFLYLSFAPLAMLTMKRATRLAPITFIIFVFWLLWAYSVQYLRYFLPALVGLALVSAWGMLMLWYQWRQQWPCLARLLPALFLGLCALGLPISFSQYWNIPKHIPLDVVVGTISRERYRTERIASYMTLQYASDHASPDSRIYGVGEFFQYLSNVPIITPFFSMEGNAILFAESEEALLEALTDAGITHIVVNRPQVVAKNWAFLVHSDSFLREHAILEYASANVYLYRLLRPGEHIDECHDVELLVNGRLEDWQDGQLSHWTAVGEPGVEVFSEEVPPRRAMRVTNHDFYQQTVSVLPGALYTLSASAQATEGQPAYAQLQIAWLDRQGRSINYSSDVLLAQGDFGQVSLIATAPDGSERAVIQVSAYSGTVYLCDLSLRERTEVNCAASSQPGAFFSSP